MEAYLLLFWNKFSLIFFSFFLFYLEKCNVFACVPCNFTESPGGQEQFFFLLDL